MGTLQAKEQGKGGLTENGDERQTKAKKIRKMSNEYMYCTPGEKKRKRFTKRFSIPGFHNQITLRSWSA